METRSGNGSVEAKSEKDAKSKDTNAPPPEDQAKTPKKRRKVNHACVYCRRSHMTCDLERPCTRCIKRNIGHLCHDEPREHETKKAKSTTGTSTIDESEAQSDMAATVVDQSTGSMGPPPPFEGRLDGVGGQMASKPAGFGAAALGRGNALLLQQAQVAGLQNNPLGGASAFNQFTGFADPWLTQNHFHDLHSYHPNYMITPEVSNEFNLLNDFLHSSLLDDSMLPGDHQNQGGSSAQADVSSEFLSANNGDNNNALLSSGGEQGVASLSSGAEKGNSISRPSSVAPVDKAREYYLQAADPAGNDTPEARMQRLLRAKYDAGLLKPFNYIKGYSRLSSYLDSHIAPSSKQKILRQLDRFRPKFREKAHALTDIELLYVEMWFEKTLMDYDRVFASMAVPACCWRRTGEIFRGNKEMAELINVPVESLRDGKIALHEILTEESVVRYWEEFGTIAFDPAHDTLLTACSLKNPDDESNISVVECCFSLKIRRDDYKIPSLIVGNFLPHDPLID